MREKFDRKQDCHWRQQKYGPVVIFAPFAAAHPLNEQQRLESAITCLNSVHILTTGACSNGKKQKGISRVTESSYVKAASDRFVPLF